MRRFLPLFALLFWAFSCTRETAPEPLEAARQKLENATSISFEMRSVWNNTFVGDTAVNAPHKGVYLRNGGKAFAYDFIYEAENTVFLYRDGKLEDVELKKGRIVTYSPAEAIDNIAYEGSYSTMMTPMMLVKDTAWTRAGAKGNVVYYDRVTNDSVDEYGHAYTIERLRIDSTTSEIIAQERIYTLNGEPMQHIRRSYSGFVFNGVDTLSYTYPEGFQTIASADLEQQEEKELIQAGDPLPEFDLVDVDGNSYSEKTLRGKKAVFVFSFIGCGGCELARKHLARTGFQFSDDYVGLYVNPMNSAEQIANYHADKPWPFKLVATDYDFSASFGVISYPTFITVGEAGTVEEVIEGYEEDKFMDYFGDKGTFR